MQRAGSDETLQALDHDFNTDSICPSVLLLYSPGEEGAAGSKAFYDGDIHVYLKDAIMCPSTPLRHAAETLKSIRHGGYEGLDVLVIKTDGGPDRNVTHVSTKVCMLALSIILDVQCLIAHRTTPGQSYVNEVERVMSLLNLALYGVALDRALCSDATEELLQKNQSMSARRTAITGADDHDPNGQHTTAFAHSMEVCAFFQSCLSFQCDSKNL